MEIVTFLILAVGLSMDSLVVALTSGAVIANHQAVNVLKIAGMLAFMQMSLTIAGWMVGHTFAQHIYEYDHWLAFGILALLGTKIIVESLKGREDDKPPFNPLDIRVMFSLAVATSIDALAVGLSLSLLDRPVAPLALVIGLVTFVVASIGIVCGSKIGQRCNAKINIIGGVILIFIGCSILYDHIIAV